MRGSLPWRDNRDAIRSIPRFSWPFGCTHRRCVQRPATGRTLQTPSRLPLALWWGLGQLPYLGRLPHAEHGELLSQLLQRAILDDRHAGDRGRGCYQQRQRRRPVGADERADSRALWQVAEGNGGFSTLKDIEALTTSDHGTIVYAPVKDEEKKRKQGEDPFAPRPGDTSAIAAWRQRMGTEEAKKIYKERAATAECVNAIARNRNLCNTIRHGDCFWCCRFLHITLRLRSSSAPT